MAQVRQVELIGIMSRRQGLKFGGEALVRGPKCFVAPSFVVQLVGEFNEMR